MLTVFTELLFYRPQQWVQKEFQHLSFVLLTLGDKAAAGDNLHIMVWGFPFPPMAGGKPSRKCQLRSALHLGLTRGQASEDVHVE